MRFYVHGAGRAGREAWPEQPEAGAVFADHSACSPMSRKADVVGEQCPPEKVVVIAHSLGAVPAALAHRAGSLTASHVVLLEPALYDVARGHAAVERHIVPMTEARERARRLSRGQSTCTCREPSTVRRTIRASSRSSRRSRGSANSL